MHTAIPLSVSEARVESQSAALRRELGLADIGFAQILFVVVPDFFGTAVKAGPSHVVFWLLAIALFFVPQALVVSHLNRLIPLEGGLYQWAKLGFGDAVGFMVAWNLWLYVVLMVAGIGLLSTTYIAYAAGPSFEWLATSKMATAAASAGIIGALVVVSLLGLGVGKWVNNAGSILTIATLGILVLLPFVNTCRGVPASNRGYALSWPHLSVFQLSVFSKMAFGALCGFEYVAIFAGECHNPRRNIVRPMLITLPVIACIYILGTGAILSYVQPNNIDVIGPIPQAFSVGFKSFGFLRPIAPLATLLLLFNYLASYNLTFAANTRLPMVAGWDRLLPTWFARLNPKHRTPVNSILFVGAVTAGLALVVLIGVRAQEAFEIVQVASFTFYGLAYLAMFALPIAGFRREQQASPLWLRAAAASGFLVTLLFVALSIFPIIDVSDRVSYTMKICGLVIGGNLLGAAILLFERRNKHPRA